MADTGIKKDVYVLGQSEKKSLAGLGEEIRLDLALKPNPNLHGGSILGKVTDSQGKPIESALIKIMDSKHNPLAHTVTGQDGSYIFSPFPPASEYHIYSIAQGYSLQEALPFPLLQDQTVEKNFTLAADPSAKLSIIAGDIVSSVDGKVIKGAVVNLKTVDTGGKETLSAITFTNDYGQYVFRDLDKGNYIVRILALGYKQSAASVLVNQDGQIAFLKTNIDVDSAASKGTVSGVITDDSGSSVSDADVILYKVGEDESLTPIAFTKTNDEGVYLFIKVPQGNYKVKSNKTTVV